MFLSKLIGYIIANPKNLLATDIRLLLLMANDEKAEVVEAGLLIPVRKDLDIALGISQGHLDDCFMRLDLSGVIELRDDDSCLIKVDVLREFPEWPYLVTKTFDGGEGLESGFTGGSSGVRRVFADNTTVLHTSSIAVNGKCKRLPTSHSLASLVSCEYGNPKSSGEPQVAPLSETKLKTENEAMKAAIEAITSKWPEVLKQAYDRWIALIHARRVAGFARTPLIYRITGEVEEIFLKLGAEATAYGLDASCKAKGGVVDNTNYCKQAAATYTRGDAPKPPRAIPKEAQKYVGRV